MRELRCCSLSPESRFSLSTSLSHSLSSLALLKVILFPLTASWMSPTASQLQCIARRRLVLARHCSLCNSPAHTLSTDDAISGQQAAGQVNAETQCNLGHLYHLGDGVQQDNARAATLYQQAADQGHTSAQCNPGQLYQFENGAQQGSTRAATLSQQAAEQGDDSAVDFVQDLLFEAAAKAAAMAEELIRDEEEQANRTKGKPMKKENGENQAAQVRLQLTCRVPLLNRCVEG